MLRLLARISALLYAATSVAMADNPPPAPAGWKLIWHDEFNGNQLDTTKWSRCKRGGADWKNTMVEDPRLLRVRRGALLLMGVVNKDTSKDPAPFHTAGVDSKGKFDFQYGKIQIRARFKSSQGAWPALWMLGRDGGWPGNGEIDLMEHLNFDDFVHQTVHSEYTVKIDKTNTPPKSATAKINRDGWNTYGAEWDRDKIVFTVNGKPTHTYPRVAEKGAKQWPFDQPFYLILSMQIGGNWVGKGDPKDYPSGMEVDWVRVYQKD
ncbi:glycoside hydrolase family 16 protein [Sulfuriroseicoccus oceanibius]|uniref:Glycoside hydrolase family 16 protein n=1 Tax=Sulfuriroseicoccus oceanibius TaxID=2707525 RepID=A0A7T7F0T6_9BACT|nr:glycoside hydrolase family 16 protein [Sulfuriroseicoccus oceanibius]QQL44716.1 glycoside hydrolase family 16 protein [Sulfuriroseicoccus oceanibius]